jgi:hypothetical protein
MVKQMGRLKDVKHGKQMEYSMENKWRSHNWRKAMEKSLLNADVGRVLIFRQSVWSAVYDVIWSARRNCLALDISGLSSWRRAVVTAPFFAVIIVAMR